MNYAEFERILVWEDNGKQNPKDSYSNKYQKHIACSYGYKLVWFDDKFSKLLKFNLSKDTIYNFINIMTKESRYCCDVIKKHFSKELGMNKERNEDFGNSTKCWISDNSYVDDDVKVRNYSDITGKYRDSVHRDCIVNIKWNHKIPAIFHNLKKYEVVLSCISFSINNKLCFIDSFQSLSSSLDSLVKNLSKDDFKYLSQEFNNDVLDLGKQKGFYPYEYMSWKI